MKKGITLIEMLIYLGLISITFTIFTGINKEQLEKRELIKTKREISTFVRKVQQYSFYDNKKYTLDFRLSKRKIYFKDEDKIIDTLDLSKRLLYTTNNKDRDMDFERSTTKTGNFGRGFSIYLMTKSDGKTHYRISTSTINSIKYPIISIYKLKEPTKINQENEEELFWIEEKY